MRSITWSRIRCRIFALKCKHLFTPLYRIGPRSEVGCQTGAMSGEVFYGQTDGRTDGRTADKKRRKNFVLGSPPILNSFKGLGRGLLRLVLKFKDKC